MFLGPVSSTQVSADRRIAVTRSVEQGKEGYIEDIPSPETRAEFNSETRIGGSIAT